MAVCSECGGALTEGALEGLCSRCLLEQGLRIVVEPASATTRSEPAKVLREFGDYQLLEEIARGGMGVVYRARQKSLDRTVAVKLLLLGPQANPEFVKRLRAEATVAAGLHHPNIVAIHEVGVQQGEHYLVMDFVDGPSLAQHVKGEPLPPRQAGQYLKAIAEAVHYAHERGVLHRDLKPSNVLIDSNDEPRVTDFGLAKRLEGESSLTVSGQVIGSPSYMPPEQASATRHHVGRRSDVYSLGAMLYHTLTGRPPFVGEELSQTLDQVLNHDPISPRLLSPAVPRDLETICLKCLEKEPARRYGTARELADELGRFLRDEPILARPVSAAGKTWRWCRRKPALASLILLVSFVGAVGVAGIAWQWRRAEARGVQLSDRGVELRRNLYASDMKLAQQALGVNNVGRALELLNSHRPAAKSEIRNPKSQMDLPGWEWRYLWKQCQSDVLFTLCHKSNSIATLAVSHDGKWLAVGEEDSGRLSIWNLDTRQEVDTLQAGLGSALVAFSPREPLLAYVNGRGVSGDFPAGLRSTNYLWNVASRERVASFSLGGRSHRSIAFSEDGKLLFTRVHISNVGNPIKFWRVPDGKEQRNYPASGGWGNAGPVLPFTVARDLSVLGCGVPRSHRVSVIELPSGKERWSRETEDEPATLAFSPDGTLLASSSGLGYSVIHLWDVRTGNEVGRLEGHRGWIGAMVFWPDGKTLASASGDQTIRLWDLTDLTNVPPPRVLIGHISEVWSLALLPDERRLVSGSKDGSVCVWDRRAIRREPTHVTLPDTLNAWRFSADCKSILAITQNGEVAQFGGPDFQDKQSVMTIAGAWTACISKDGRFVATAHGNSMVGVWDVQQRALLREREFKDGLQSGTPMHFLAEGTRLNIGFLFSDLVEQWDLVTDHLTFSRRDRADAAACSPDERRWLLFYSEGRTTFRDVTTGLITNVNFGMKKVTAAAWSPDGRVIAASSWLGSVKLWDAATLRDVGTMPGFLQGAYSVNFSPDSKRLAAGGDSKEAIKIWDVEGRLELLTLEGEGSVFNRCEFSPDGNILAAMNQKNVLHLWRAPSWEEIAAAEKKTGSRAIEDE